MSSFPNLRFAVFTDPHIGSDTSGGWHNRRLTDDPAATLRATVAAVNGERAHFAVVLGDLAEIGAEGELRAARQALDDLAMPWIACRGNHDVPPDGDRTLFERVLGERAALSGSIPAEQLPMPPGVLAVAFDAEWRDEDGKWRVFVPDAQVANVLATLDAERPDALLVFGHFPLIRQSAYLQAQRGKNAGTLWDGMQLLDNLAARVDALLCFTGHQHFHHMRVGANWLHCTTAALVEYPAEYRVVTLGPDPSTRSALALNAVQGQAVRIETRCGAPQIVAAAPAPQATWVRGREEHRERLWNRPAPVEHWVWVFTGPVAGRLHVYPSAVFEQLADAEAWIKRHGCTGTLARYPVNTGAYDWAVERGIFEPTQEQHYAARFIETFSDAAQEHYHYEHGVRIAE